MLLVLRLRHELTQILLEYEQRPKPVYAVDLLGVALAIGTFPVTHSAVPVVASKQARYAADPDASIALLHFSCIAHAEEASPADTSSCCSEVRSASCKYGTCTNLRNEPPCSVGRPVATAFFHPRSASPSLLRCVQALAPHQRSNLIASSASKVGNGECLSSCINSARLRATLHRGAQSRELDMRTMVGLELELAPKLRGHVARLTSGGSSNGTAREPGDRVSQGSEGILQA